MTDYNLYLAMADNAEATASECRAERPAVAARFVQLAFAIRSLHAQMAEKDLVIADLCDQNARLTKRIGQLMEIA